VRLGTYYYGLITLAFELIDLEKNKIGERTFVPPLIYLDIYRYIYVYISRYRHIYYVYIYIIYIYIYIYIYKGWEISFAQFFFFL